MARIKVIYGSPCSGKSTYVSENLKDMDIRFDYDLIMKSISNKNAHEYSDEHLPYVIEYRGIIIDKANVDENINVAYIIASKITDKLKDELKSLEVEYYLVDKTKQECYEQLENDETREDKEFWKEKINDWFEWHEEYQKGGEQMNVLEVKGPIVSNDDYWIYEWLDIEATCPKVINKQLKEFTGQDVTVEINSPGGSVFAGSEIYTSLKSYPGNVKIQIVGMAASAASVIAMAGHKVVMSPTAQIMIHNASTISQGDYRDMEHAAEFLKGINESISNAYKIKSGMSTEELLVMMDNETWITSKKALELGLIDEVMFENEIQLVASFNGMIPIETINKIRSTIKKPNNQGLELKKKEIENKLKEIDLTLELKK